MLRHEELESRAMAVPLDALFYSWVQHDYGKPGLPASVIGAVWNTSLASLRPCSLICAWYMFLPNTAQTATGAAPGGRAHCSRDGLRGQPCP